MWIARWRSFVILRIRLGVRISVPARGDVWVVVGEKTGKRGLLMVDSGEVLGEGLD